MEHSEQLQDLGAALAKAQATIKEAVRDGKNPHFKSKYSTLAAVWDACRKELTDNGLSVVQAPCSSGAEGYFGLTTMLLHSSGQWIRETAFVHLAKDDAQGAASACTYLRRFCLAAFVSVVPDEDDDGNASSGQRQESAPRQQQRQAAPESRGDAAATKNGASVASWKVRCEAKLDQLFPQAKGSADLQLAIASAVIGKAIETFAGWEDARHWRGYMEKLEKLAKPDVNKIISDAFATVTGNTSEPGALALEDPFDDAHPAQQPSAMAQGA